MILTPRRLYSLIIAWNRLFLPGFKSTSGPRRRTAARSSKFLAPFEKRRS